MDNASKPSDGKRISGPAIERSISDLADELMIAVRKLELDLHPQDDNIRHLALDADLNEARL